MNTGAQQRIKENEKKRDSMKIDTVGHQLARKENVWSGPC